MHAATRLSGKSTEAATRVAAVIPARYASTRLPGKPLADIGGRPMVEYVYRRAAAATTVDAVIVATDDERVARAVREFGGDARMTRGDHLNGTDRVAEVADGLDYDLIVNVQADEPLIEPTMIDAAVAACANNADVVMSTLRSPIHVAADLQDPDVVKVAVDRDGYALFFSRAPIGLSRAADDAQGTPAAAKHIGLYVYRRPFLLTVSRLEPTPLERS
ncbi:MAG: 3-deoxy-manno-octulosonate cytidylyltransferase, partial [bacterium]